MAAAAAAPYSHCRRFVSTASSSSISRPFSTGHNHRNNNKPGQGGISEERQIAQALRTIHDHEYQVVVEVMNACHVDWASRHLPSRGLLQRSAKLWIRVLTHADLLSEKALEYQMERASFMMMNTQNNKNNGHYQIPVIALNLRDAETNKKKIKSLHPVMQMLLGARMVASDDTSSQSPTKSPKILVCGLPNAGKSSFIYPLTKHRTKAVKKKKGKYHLPSISSTSGWTLGTKSHAFDLSVPTKSSNGEMHDRIETVSLTDTPGLRPRLDDISHDEATLAVWLATQGMKPQKGMLSKGNNNNAHADIVRKHILTILWRGLRRHAQMSCKQFAFESPEDLWSFHSKKLTNGDDSVHHFIQSCALGDYGGMIIEDETTPSMLLQQGEHHQHPPLTINLNSAVMAMNQSAMLLTDVGAGKQTPNDEQNYRVFLPKSRNKSGQENNLRKQQQYMGEGRKIADAEATSRPRERHPRKEDGCVTVFVGNLNIDIDKDTMNHTVRETFKDCGEIVSIRLADYRETGVLKGFGLVIFVNSESTDKAVAMAGTRIMGRPIRVDYDRTKGNIKAKVIRLPEHQHRLECMKCAGFIKSNRLGELSGTHYPRVLDWKEHDIRSFYSRMTEAFFGEKWRYARYLMNDSLALTLKNKYKLSSRRKVYKKFSGKDLGGYPVPSEERPRRFQSDQPVPLLEPIVCTNRSKSACRLLAVEKVEPTHRGGNNLKL